MLLPEITSPYECSLLCLLQKYIDSRRETKFEMYGARSWSIENSSKHQKCKIARSREFVQWLVKWKFCLLRDILANAECAVIKHLTFIFFWRGIVLNRICHHPCIFKAQSYSSGTDRQKIWLWVSPHFTSIVMYLRTTLPITESVTRRNL